MLKIENARLSATFTMTGASLMRLELAGSEGSVVLGFDDPAEYSRNPAFLGSVIGRVSNRIGGAQFDIGDGPTTLNANEGGNQLHGGAPGWSHRQWDIACHSEESITFHLRSNDGDQGFLGNVEASVTYRLSGAALDVEIIATTDRPTPLALTTHSYFRLGEDQRLWLNCFAFTSVDAQLIPTGQVTEQTPFHPNLTKPLDSNFCVATMKDGKVRHHATLQSHANGIVLDVHSNEPGIQVYNACGMSAEQGPGLYPFAGVALEPQMWPNAVHHDHFPNIVLLPGDEYRHISRYDFSRSKV